MTMSGNEEKMRRDASNTACGETPQPLPQPAVPMGVDFETVGEEYWRVDRFDLLSRDFGIGVAELGDWHEVLSGQGMAWTIAERIYQVGSLTDPPDDVLRSWTRAEVAKRYSIPVAQVDAEIENAVKHWKLTRARRELDREVKSEVGRSEIDILTNFSNADGLAVEDIDRLLEAFNFKEVKDPLMRVQVVKRILSLKDYLASPHTRTAAREIIRFEITMHGLEMILTMNQNKMQRLAQDDPELRVSGGEIDGLAAKCKDLDTEIRKIGGEHAKRQKEIGADDIDMTTRKRIFVETVAFIQEKCREYESEPENVMVDGVFRAGEIDWLLDPLGGREAQYRPDISVRLADALLPENLWDPEYVPPKITIRVCQELRKIVEQMRKVPVDAPPLIELDDEDEVANISEGMAVPLEVADEAAQAVPMGGYRYGRRDEDDGGEIMGVY